MSNLWFFRLSKRVEQQRRRSSGDSRQSVGSAQSAHSAASNGGAASASTGAEQQQQSPLESTLESPTGFFSAEQQQQQPSLSAATQPTSQPLPSSSSSQHSQRQRRLLSARQRSVNKATRAASTTTAAKGAVDLCERQRRFKRNYIDVMSNLTRDANQQQCGVGGGADSASNSTAPQPQTVTIQLTSAADDSSAERANTTTRNATTTNEADSTAAQLTNAATLASSKPHTQPSMQAQDARAPLASTRQLQQTTSRDATQSEFRRRAIHNQLIEGKVPEIHECLTVDGQPTSSTNNYSAAKHSIAESVDNLASLIPRVRVEFHNSENTLRERLQNYFIRDTTVSLYVRTVKLILNVLACYFYIHRAILDRGPFYASCYGCELPFRANASSHAIQLSSSSASKFDNPPYDGPINFRAIFWVDRGPITWLFQTMIASVCLADALLMQYLTHKNNIYSVRFLSHFTIELVTTIPFILSIFFTKLRTLFVPTFLSSWLAKQCLERMLNDLSIVRQSSLLSHRLTILSATLFCLLFTSACGFQHAQRCGGRNVNIFESIYFTIVTLSTVGYGDIKPETWPSQVFVAFMLSSVFMVLPSQVEQLAFYWIERKKLGARLSHHSNSHEKHVVVCSTTLRADTIMDFLNEFYAHPLLQTFSVVLLSPCELDTTMKLVLQTPTWNNRVVYIQGSALKAADLIRARMQSAESCFILAARNYHDRSAADEHTILRSWAIRDFSPYVPQYVQIFRTQNKIHVAFAEHVVCDDEFKYALLANNCFCPGTSTLVTLLLHTSQRQIKIRPLFKRNPIRTLWRACFAKSNNKTSNIESNNDDKDNDDDDSDDDASEPEWKRLYGKCSANEIYHIRLADSRFFGEYQGKSFTYASFHSHRKFGVALIGVQTDMRGAWPIMLNPGPSYVLKKSDILFYINITKEESSTLKPMKHQFASQQTSNVVELKPDSSPPHGNGGDGKQEGGSGEASEPLVPPQTSSSTVIRVQSSSSTKIDTMTCLQSESPEYCNQNEGGLSAKKHSIADCASMVTRSVCSMAGLSNIPAVDIAEKGSYNAATSLDGALTYAMRHDIKNASNLELASGSIRKGSNISIASTKSRDLSTARIKQVVSGLADRMRRVKIRKSLTHLTIPRLDYGASNSSSTESFVHARGRRPSIAPVPAMMGESEDHDSDHDREQESYFSTSWHSTSESSPIVKGFPPCSTYVGVSPTLCYLLQKKKSPCCLQLIQGCEHNPRKNVRGYKWQARCIILVSDFAGNGIYNFLVPLRAHFHKIEDLRPIVLLLERKPSAQFIDAIAWFPMVYWMPGLIDNLDDLIKAGINIANSVVVTNKESTNSVEEDYLADCNTIVAVQSMFKLFPSVSIITELSQSSNMRFMQFRAHDLLFRSLNMVQRKTKGGSCRHRSYASDSGDDDERNMNECLSQIGSQNRSIGDRSQIRKFQSKYYSKTFNKELNSHAYKYRLPFAAGNVFSASMLDTLLYQAFIKDYLITMVRLLLGIDQAPGSGFLSSMKITKEDLWIRTYGRLYQRLCSTTCEIPLGIYRTEPLNSNRCDYSFSGFASQQASYEHATEELERAEIINLVRNRLDDLNMPADDYENSNDNRNKTFSYVIINPNCDVTLKEGDLIYLIRPSPIHSRKLFMNRASSVRVMESRQTAKNAAVAAAEKAAYSEASNHSSGSSKRQSRNRSSKSATKGTHSSNGTTSTEHQFATDNNANSNQQPTIVKSSASDSDIHVGFNPPMNDVSEASQRRDSCQILIHVSDSITDTALSNAADSSEALAGTSLGRGGGGEEA